MLTHIHIKNFTIIESLSIDFDSGLSVLTGETGAGKSIWVDAVNYALGARADSGVIRHGESRCEITLCFDLSNHKSAQQWLNEQDYNDDNECIIRRIISIDSASRASINGRPCPLQLIRDFGGLLLNIHSQHENQALLKRTVQQYRLDMFANNEKLLDEIDQIHQQWKSAHHERETLNALSANRDAEVNLLRYQLNELETLQLKDNEWEELSHQHQQCHHAKDLITQINHAIDLTTDSDSQSAAQLLQQAVQQLNNAPTQNPQIESAKELLNTAIIHCQEAGETLDHYRNQIDLSPENLAMLEDRLTKIHDLARKHHTAPENLTEIQKSLTEKLQQFENIDAQQETLSKLLEQLNEQYQQLANKLSLSRKKAASILEKTITKNIQDLGIEGGQFRITFENREQENHPDGQEKILFEVSSNPGQPFHPLAKIVSGGELSRISLALQVITAKKDHTPTMIFDEVDTGIGGKTAETVGQLLRQLGQTAQVLCITHLAQVAAQGHHHYKIMKSSNKKITTTNVEKLDKKERIDELARMLSGAKITKQTLAHASELLVE